MTDTYAGIASDYQEAKRQPWRRHVEDYSFFELLGDVAGKAVLDLACGEGYYTRQLRERGAARVVGVDISPAMIALAGAEEVRRPLGIEYRIEDAARYEPAEPFDVVVAAYLLNYARSTDELLALCRAVARALKPGCRFVSVNDNPAQPLERFACTREHGLTKSITGALREGAPIHVTLYLEDRSICFDNYHFSPLTYERALHSAGFRTVRWHLPQLDPAVEVREGRERWQGFLVQPPVIFLECVREA